MTSYGFTGQYAPNAQGFGSAQSQSQSQNQGQGQTPLNVEDFSQFLPPTPNGQNLQLPMGWENMSFNAMTPGSGSNEAFDFAKMFEGVESWPGGVPTGH